MRGNPAYQTDKERAEGISVILCCYNSSPRLPETLKHLAMQRLPDRFQWEVILVNNASTDRTAEEALEIWTRLRQTSTRLRIVDESRAGQQNARLTGARQAAFDLLLFCDDDNWLDADYLHHAEKTMRLHRDTGAAGGQNLPVTNASQYPDWFEEYQDKYALGIPADNSGDISSRGFLLGAGMVTRAALFLEMYDEKFPSLLKGRKADNLSTGDDFEYCKRLLLRDWHLYFEKEMKLRHFIPGERLSITYRDKLMRGIEQAGTVINEYDLAVKIRNRYKNKNRLRLLLLAPFRILMTRLGMTNRKPEDEKNMLYYLTPVAFDKNSVRKEIKKFIRG